MISFWEREHFQTWDYIVLGAGIVGLSTALELRTAQPHASILVLERGLLPTGASTKNAGFACFGSLTEILDDLKTMTPEQVQELVHLRWDGLRLLRERLGDEVMGLETCGGYELIAPHLAESLSQMGEVNNLLYPLFDKDVFRLADDRIPQMGFQPEGFRHLVRNPFEAAINTGATMQALLAKVRAADITLITGAEVTRLERVGDAVHVYTQSGLHFRTPQLGVCTNAFAAQLLPQLAISPGRGIVLVTKPLDGGVPFRGVFHMDEGYVYFRHLGNDRVLLGGGRNRFRDAEETTSFALNPEVVNYLQDLMTTVILPGKQWHTDIIWSGIMAFGDVKRPLLQRINTTTSIGVRMGGMGVAIGSKVGQQLAGIMRGQRIA